jgi:hypothetical protein
MIIGCQLIGRGKGGVILSAQRLPVDDAGKTMCRYMQVFSNSKNRGLGSHFSLAGLYLNRDFMSTMPE